MSNDLCLSGHELLGVARVPASQSEQALSNHDDQFTFSSTWGCHASTGHVVACGLRARS